jgi:hypothetical protein
MREAHARGKGWILLKARVFDNCIPPRNIVCFLIEDGYKSAIDVFH